MHNNNNYQCKMCWNKVLTFGVGSIQLSFHTIVFTQYMQRCFRTTFQLNCAEGLHFSAFHLCLCVCVCLCAHVFLCVCACLYLCVFVCVCACMRACACEWVGGCVSTYMYMCVLKTQVWGEVCLETVDVCLETVDVCAHECINGCECEKHTTNSTTTSSAAYVQKMWLGRQTESFQNVGGRRCIQCINFLKLGGQELTYGGKAPPPLYLPK